MIIECTGKGLKIISNPLRIGKYIVLFGSNGKKYVDIKSVGDYLCHITEGNSKVGDVLGFNLPIEYSCDHRCECYRNGDCYACTGFYQQGDNQRDYSENYNYYRNHSSEVFVATLQMAIDRVREQRKRSKNNIAKDLEEIRKELAKLDPEFQKIVEEAVLAQIERYGKTLMWRYFTIGDIPDGRFLECMIALAKANPDVSFWSYTKRYHIVNRWIDKNGDLPDNLVIVFSHWMNNDGSYFPMKNPHHLPTSEYIPAGREDLLAKVTWVCPCSDPNWIGTCETCPYRCGTLKKGQSIGLMAHSTPETRKRDAEVRAQRKTMWERIKEHIPGLAKLTKRTKMHIK